VGADVTRPLLLDLFCGAGGSAVGYHRAGFDVVGVDVASQPHYPFPFVRADAMTYPLDGFDAIHASPPCQAYSMANNIHGRSDHPQLIEPTRARLIASGVPYVIENVPGSPLIDPYVLCGLALGVNVKRHRLFETPIAMLVPECPYGHPGDWLLVFGRTVLERGHTVGRAKGGGPSIRRRHVGTDRGREAMGIDWMTRDELSQAIPPAYTEHIGAALLDHISSGRVALDYPYHPAGA